VSVTLTYESFELVKVGAGWCSRQRLAAPRRYTYLGCAYLRETASRFLPIRADTPTLGGS